MAKAAIIVPVTIVACIIAVLTGLFLQRSFRLWRAKLAAQRFARVLPPRPPHRWTIFNERADSLFGSLFTMPWPPLHQAHLPTTAAAIIANSAPTAPRRLDIRLRLARLNESLEYVRGLPAMNAHHTWRSYLRAKRMVRETREMMAKLKQVERIVRRHMDEEEYEARVAEQEGRGRGRRQQRPGRMSDEDGYETV